MILEEKIEAENSIRGEKEEEIFRLEQEEMELI